MLSNACDPSARIAEKRIVSPAACLVLLLGSLALAGPASGDVSSLGSATGAVAGAASATQPVASATQPVASATQPVASGATVSGVTSSSAAAATTGTVATASVTEMASHPEA